MKTRITYRVGHPPTGPRAPRKPHWTDWAGSLLAIACLAAAIITMRGGIR